MRGISIDPRSHAMSSAQAMCDARKLAEIVGRLTRRDRLRDADSVFSDGDKLALIFIYQRLPDRLAEPMRRVVEGLCAAEVGRAIAQLGAL